MKIGAVREFKVPAGVNKGKTVYTRTVLLQPNEREPGLVELMELQDAMQASYPGQLVSVQTRISAFTPVPAAATEDDGAI